MEEFHAAIKEEHYRIPLSELNELIASMTEQVQTMSLRDGDATRS